MQEISDQSFVLKFSMGTIEHLGIQMYQTLPPVVSELISNAYDADAENVEVTFFDTSSGDKKITIKDDGNGMSFDDINSKFLLIGRNRRLSEDNGNFSPNKHRKVTGRKGIGKLAIFGIAEEIYIKTIKNGIKNELRLSLPSIKKCESTSNETLAVYSPEAISVNVKVNDESDGTFIELDNIKRKSPFNVEDLVNSISKRFTFDDEDFIVKFYHNNEQKAEITKNTKWEIFNGQFEWAFPDSKDEEYSYAYQEQINGKIITTEKPLDESSKGITLFARGKLVNRNEFYGIKITTSNAYNYMTGFLNVDFIDDFDDDLINTSRDGLVWDNDSLEGLKHWIQHQVKNIEKQWREKRIAARIIEYQEKHEGKSYNQWVESLPKHERKLATDIVNTIILNEKIPEEVTETLLQYVENSFQYTSFKDFASEIDSLEINSPELTTKLLALFKDWQAIEAKEFYKLCIGRIETIKKLEKLIDENAREVPEIHTFLKTYPWLMEPRIKDFNDEITFTKLLRDEFKEDDSIPESDKRIDFYCKSFDNNVYIYELKRPNITAKTKELNQLTAYKEFVEKHCGNEQRSYQNVYCYLLCKGISLASPGAQTTANALMGQNIYVRTYHEILGQAYNYHKEFIDKYKEMKSVNTQA